MTARAAGGATAAPKPMRQRAKLILCTCEGVEMAARLAQHAEEAANRHKETTSKKAMQQAVAAATEKAAAWGGTTARSARGPRPGLPLPIGKAPGGHAAGQQPLQSARAPPKRNNGSMTSR